MRLHTKLPSVVALACSLAAIGALPVGAQDLPPAMVSLAEAVQAEFAPLHWASGSVVSREDSRVASELDGRVMDVAEVGQTVARGDVLARLDDAALKLRERDDQANLARIEAQLEYARSQEQRYDLLAAQASIASSQLDQARSERRVLEQDLVRARVALERTRHEMRQSIVRAPFDGVVAERFIQRGEYLATGAPVVRLVNPKAIEIRARAPVELAGQLAAATRVTLRVGNTVSEQLISALVPIGDETSRQLELRIAVQDSELSIGAAVEVGLPSAEPRLVVAVPRDALMLRREGNYVLRVSDELIAERVRVDTGTAQNGLIEVRGALEPGDQLIIRGGERVQPGQRVQGPNLASLERRADQSGDQG
ncbi:MAG TPA: efflux RND transporter periplasmic adaptor subunit [Steroidobacteraceae bacterium]|nr:efflux RND transporter periplasmic adaptor subunit [Steroidobacteraceae bacterium]